MTPGGVENLRPLELADAPSKPGGGGNCSVTGIRDVEVESIGGAGVDLGSVGADAVVPVETGRAQPSPEGAAVVVDPQGVADPVVLHEVVGGGHPQRPVVVCVVPVLDVGKPSLELGEERLFVGSGIFLAHRRTVAGGSFGAEARYASANRMPRGVGRGWGRPGAVVRRCAAAGVRP